MMHATKRTIAVRKRSQHGLTTGLVFLLATLAAGPAQGKPSGGSVPDQITALQGQLEQQQSQINTLQNQVNQLVEQVAPPIETVLTAVTRGTYEANGTAHVGASAVYFAGEVFFSGVLREFRNFFIFDLNTIPGVGEPTVPPGPGPGVCVVSGVLSLFNPPNGFLSSQSDTETYVLNRAGIFFDAQGTNRTAELMQGTLGVAGFTDLADGPGYGSYVASARQNGVRLEIPLSPRAIFDMNQRLAAVADLGPTPGTYTRYFAIGGSISTLDEVVDTEGLFGESGSQSNTSIGLELEFKRVPHCPESSPASGG